MAEIDLNQDEQDRTCPVCGKVEPVSTNAILHAIEEGLPDEWVCWACWTKKAVA
jgi:rubredoxin